MTIKLITINKITIYINFAIKLPCKIIFTLSMYNIIVCGKYVIYYINDILQRPKLYLR